ncbi:ergothioneine biosynthesis protein EgtB [Exiguobacterium antarcticum]|uniref:Ergothioneine biosynthesis protein EgtB n=1 Tax=Exiguobacterium antarcticum TaxID=132920 RepID=A0ABT6R3I6_9BACL|nr:ergothioneine biosynthesis protein EgtB [Exiguobacterium antarcticum]MDI3235501.1 ergothioneine biosynthesis protein EgtB [Exiguobacterium antarcticum]
MRLETTTYLIDKFSAVRKQTLSLIEPLEQEDFVIQANSDVSPPKWHIAHTTWFFERMILQEYDAEYIVFHPAYNYLFNSYYNSIGPYQPRHQRGVLSRPTVREVLAYREHVDQAILSLLQQKRDEPVQQVIEQLIEMGLQHEQQHQELILMDVKYNFFVNPLLTAYQKREKSQRDDRPVVPLEFKRFEGGLVEIGHDGQGFAFDNENPVHKTWLDPFELATRPVTNREFLAFVEALGYDQSEHWLSDGFHVVQQQNWKAPLYWMKEKEGTWSMFTLNGVEPLDLDEPVCHVSFYEADAYSRWCGKRLPTEAEWEYVGRQVDRQGNLMGRGSYHPSPIISGSQEMRGMFGDIWEWTASAYAPYPGNRPLEGALGEYNAKFMCNQMVLRGGACVTPDDHIRETYRNFFPPDKRWQFSGIRLAGDVQ